MEDKEIDKITEELYIAYGSGTGVLFGIPSNLRPAVRAIVKVVVNRNSHKIEIENNEEE